MSSQNKRIRRSGIRRRLFTHDEEDIMIRFIVTSRRFSEIKGRNLYVDMSESGLIQRSWSSLWEHFRKKIIPVLHTTRFEITNEDRLKLMRCSGYYNDKYLLKCEWRIDESQKPTQDDNSSNP